MIAIVTAIGGFPFAPRQSALLSFVGAGVPAAVFAILAIPGPTPKLGLLRLLARFFLPPAILMTIMGAGVYAVYAYPAKHSYLRRPPRRRRGSAPHVRLPARADGAHPVLVLHGHSRCSC